MGKKAKEEVQVIDVSKDELTTLIGNFCIDIAAGASTGYIVGESIGTLITAALHSTGVPVQINGAVGASFGAIAGMLKACGKTFSWLYQKYDEGREKAGGYEKLDLGYSYEYLNECTR
jgi:hypothetical protein